MKPIWLSIAIVFLFSAAPADAQFSLNDAVKKIEARFEPAEARPGQTVTFKLIVELNKGWYTYATFQPDPKAQFAKNVIVLPAPGEVVFVEPVQDPPNFKTKSEPELEVKEQRIYPGGATWEMKAIVSPRATPGVKKVTLRKVEILLCVKKDDGSEFCLAAPYRGPISADLTVLDEPAVPVDPRYLSALLGNPAANSDTKPANPAPSAKDIGLRIAKSRDYAADMQAVQTMIPRVESGQVGFVAFVLAAMFWGAVTLLTPCVFPMVPITVSYFLKQGEKKQHNPLAMALVYTATIIVVLGVAALFFLSAFQKLSTNPWMNLALGLLFVVFALSLFGMYDIVLPSFLVRFTSAREGQGGYGGVVFMALSFSIVSFTCVAPFLGGFAGMAASGNFSNLQLGVGAFAFAGTFAAPFFLLAIFPSLLKKLPKSGSWMNTIKVVMGFLELAAAFKFFRTAELRWSIPPALFTYDFVLSLWVVMLVLAGLYLLNFYRLPHDEPQDHIGVMRLLCGLLSISVGLYLLPALFAGAGSEKQRPGGTLYAWVDAFLLPEPSAAETVGGGELAWSADLRSVIETARAEGEPVFVDFTGVTCTNCKLNEKSVFPRPEIKDLLKKYRLAQLYTDTIPPEYYSDPPDLAQREADAAANRDFERDRFQTLQLPLYVLLKPQPGPPGGPVKILGVYQEGKINEVKDFEEFLKRGLVK
jgi:thiol:disulfide interchange protein